MPNPRRTVHTPPSRFRDMTEIALLQGVRRELMEVLGYEGEWCRVEASELAVLNVGHVFIGVHPGTVTPGPTTSAHGNTDIIDKVVGFRISVTVRFAALPEDRRSDNLFLDSRFPNLEEQVDPILNVVHGSYEILERANKHLAEQRVPGWQDGFIEPAYWAGTGAPGIVDSAVFQGAPGANAGMRRMIDFGGARRIYRNVWQESSSEHPDYVPEA